MVPEVGGVIEGVSECLSIKTGLLYLTRLKLEPTRFDSSSPPAVDDSKPALSPDPLVTVEVISQKSVKVCKIFFCTKGFVYTACQTLTHC